MACGNGPVPGHLDQRDVGIRIRADHFGAQGAAVGELHRQALGAFDHVVIGEDVAFGIDQEAGAGAAPRRVAAAAARIERIVRTAPAALFDQPPRAAAARGRIDVHDRGIEARGDVREVQRRRTTTAACRRSRQCGGAPSLVDAAVAGAGADDRLRRPLRSTAAGRPARR